MANRWYVALDGEELGPLSDTGLERLVQGGRVEGETLVRNGAGGDWMPVYLAEEILAARPSRQRPGEAAIQAARESKQAVTRPACADGKPRRPSAPGKSPPAQQGDLAAEANPVDSPPAAMTESASASASGHSELPTDPPQPTSAFSSSLARLGIGMGALSLFAGSFAAGWFMLAATGRPKSTPIPAPGPHPQLAALRQQAEQLRQEIAEKEQQLSNPATPDAPPPQTEMPPSPPQTSPSPAADAPPTEPPESAQEPEPVSDEDSSAEERSSP